MNKKDRKALLSAAMAKFPTWAKTWRSDAEDELAYYPDHWKSYDDAGITLDYNRDTGQWDVIIWSPMDNTNTWFFDAPRYISGTHDKLHRVVTIYMLTGSYEE